MPEHGAASRGCAIQRVLLGNTMLSGRPVISPAVTGIYLMACHASLYMLAETEAERSVQLKVPISLYSCIKRKTLGKKRVSVT